MATPKAYGLTGGVATGKSTVGKMFAALGAKVICADQLSRKLCEVGQVGWQKVKDAFGAAILNPDQSLNRQKLSDLVFSNAKKRKKLEAILHPFIMEEAQKQTRTYFDQGQGLVMIEAALLIEAGYASDFHGLIVVTCRPEQQIERLCARQAISKEKAQKMIAAQMPLAEKEKKATFILDNSGDLSATQAQVQIVYDKIKPKADRVQPKWN